MDELYQKRNSCEYEYNLCDKEYKLWQESGFSLNYKFDGRHTLLSMAAKNGYTNIIKTLIKSGINIDGNFKRTPLHEAVDDGRKEMVEFLLANGADVNAKTELIKKTPLHYAVEKASEQGNTDDYKKYVEIIEFLIAKGADVNAGDKNEDTPLHCTGDINIIKLLLANGANINARNSRYSPCSPGSSLLDMVARGRSVDLARFLIDNGANVNIRNARGDTPLHQARDQDMVNLLIEKGVEIDAKDNKGFTALHSAACSYYDEAKILTLIKHGADPWAKSNEGSTPIDYYIREWNREGQPPEPGYLMKLKKAYDKDLIVRYSTLLIGAIAAITLFTTGNITPDAPRIIGAAALVTIAALATGRITYEVFKPSTKIEEVEQECLIQEDKAR